MMLEIKIRLRAIDECLSKRQGNLSTLDVEFCFLQLRKAVEQICFAAIVCDHERYKDFRSLEGETDEDNNGDYTQDWNARIILQNLNDISPHFMPRPLGKKTSTEGKHHFDIKDLNATHKKLIKIYKKCGAYMHIPKPFGEDYEEHIAKQRKKYKTSTNIIISYLKYFKELLWHHAAIGLDYQSEGDKLNSLEFANTKNAWVINFGEYESNDIEILVAIAV